MISFSDHNDAQNAVRRGFAVRVVLDVEDFYRHGEDHHADNYLRMLGFKRKDKFKFCTILSEIANMPGHYVVLGKSGEIIPGLHGDIFYIDDDMDDFDMVSPHNVRSIID